MPFVKCLPAYEAFALKNLATAVLYRVATYAVINLIPDGQSKFPHPWPPQIPPGKTAGL